MMRLRIGLLCIASLLSSPVWAFTCNFNVEKTCCWTPFTVTVNAVDVYEKNVLTSVTIPKGQSTGKSTFDCKPSQQIQLTATFTPTIWDEDKDKVYVSKQYIVLKSQISPEDVEWNILPVVFPDMFAEVPLPLNTTNCKCAEGPAT